MPTTFTDRVDLFGAGTRIKNSGGVANDFYALTATIAELNLLDGCTALTAELNLLDGVVAGVTFIIGSEAANVINVSLQLTDVAGSAVSGRRILLAYLSDDANGDGITATVPDGNVAINASGCILSEPTTDKCFLLLSTAAGVISLDIGHSAAKTYYLVVQLPSGKIVASTQIAFT